uniref:CHK kinase-like domain-containing protein n=1 Tax=Anopheles atroparvus TaxID=41427 RepID=A0A182J9E2_ANOAO
MAESTNVPEWMTKEFFVDAIATKFDLPVSEITIVDLDVRPATEAGDNYASVLYRVRVSVQVHGAESQTAVSLIVKALPKLALSEEMVQQMNLFPKEMAMYGKVLPALEQLYHQRGRSEVVFGPRCLKHGTEPTDVIVLEDMRDREFRMANRRQGMDMEHIHVVLRRLAEFHAGTVAHFGQRGPVEVKFLEGMFAEKGRKMHEQFQALHAAFLHKVISGWSEKGKFIADLMKHWGMDMFDAMLRVTRADPDKFNVLNHGDMWCNNVLFHYNPDSAIDEIVLIDYQLSFWASPAIDLLYFMMTSVNGDLRLPQMDYMIRYYHERLIENLDFLEYTGKRPSLKELHSDVIGHHLFGFMISLSLLPVCLMEKTDDASMDLMLDQGDAGAAFKLKMYNNPEYVRQMEQLMEYYYNMGAFDILHLGTQRSARVEHDPAIQLPLWLDREFLEHIVNQKFGIDATEKRTVRGAYVKNAAKKGDNYAAALYSVKVDLFWASTATEEILSLIIKAPPKGTAAAYTLDKEMYVRERYVYETLVPAFEALFRTKGESVKLGARYYTPPSGLPVEVIVLEDLVTSGYRMANRQEGLDRAHTETVLDHLAKFHAASAVYCESGPPLPTVLTQSYSDLQMAKKTDELFRPSLDSLFEYMKGWDFAEEYTQDLELVSRRIYQLLVDTWAVNTEGFNVLNHGDAWMNNMLFSHENGTVAQVAFVDYQFSAWGSPVFDLIQFLFSSVSHSLKLSEQARFLRFYQEKLIQYLRLLGYTKPLPTLQRLQIDFNDRLLAAIKVTVIDLPYVLADTDDNASVEAAVTQTEAGRRFQKRLFDSDRYKEQMKVLLPYFRNRGLLTPEAASTSRSG